MPVQEGENRSGRELQGEREREREQLQGNEIKVTHTADEEEGQSASKKVQ